MSEETPLEGEEATGDAAPRPSRRPRSRAHRLCKRLARPVVERFRASLQLRVVTATLAASASLVVIFGFVVAATVTNGLLSDQREVSVQDARDAAVTLADNLSDYTSPRDAALSNAFSTYLTNLLDQTNSATAYTLSTSDGTVAQTRPVEADTTVSPELADSVNGGYMATQYQTLSLDDGETPYLVVGVPIDNLAVEYELYAYYPLTNQNEAVNLLRTSLVVAGGTLVLLLGVIAGLVTRLVVSPVRQAAATAHRLAAGLLHERMAVRGKDDLARLAGSFNLMAANLQTQIRRLETLSVMQRRFTSDVSHELRTPLSTIRMAADLLYAGREDFDEPTRRSTELLATELNRFEDLLSELLEISRFDSGFAQLDTEAVDLEPIVAEVIAGFSALAEECGVEIELDAPSHHVVAEVDVPRFTRIVRNLVGNAIEHAEARPVTVTIRDNDTCVALSVRDRGIGLKPGEAERVFDRFWRADPSRNRKTGGTGLGLAISSEDAKLHNGTLQAVGEPGRGTLFLLTLPLQKGNRAVNSPIALALDDDEGDSDGSR
ncbi:MtrAB system histidine kinase MtrB [Haloglycomyces albus]|uniref:MtrAB system histidine kinase MtrB n=1 Tax=Haloglycomyces albus TaxID=526067 RepID=UPI00046D7334|nr:MtrAB system histidine kinase MtrB [Haloglycomyces albus]